MTKEERAYNYASKQKASKYQVGEIAKFYNDGYQQAEKDLALTIEDVKTIDQLLWDLCEEYSAKNDNEGYFKEVLNRFNKLKGK